MTITRTRKIQVIHTLLRARDLRRLRRTLERLDDVQIASQLDNLDFADQRQVMQQLSVERRPEVLSAMRYEAAGPLLAKLAPEEAATLLDEMETDDAVDILQRLGEDELRQIMARLDKEDIDEIEELLAYDENTAGGLMSTHYFRVSPDATVGDALAMIQDDDEPPETAFYVYIVDDDERLRDALRLVQAEAIVAERGGLDFEVGERGSNLSVGEAQLVAFARVAAREPTLLILDEATASVDSITEQKVQRAIEELLRGRSVLVIAHRLSTVRRADKILVMQEGRVVEMGPHAELMEAGGVYAELYNQGFAEAPPE